MCLQDLKEELKRQKRILPKRYCVKKQSIENAWKK